MNVRQGELSIRSHNFMELNSGIPYGGKPLQWNSDFINKIEWM